MRQTALAPRRSSSPLTTEAISKSLVAPGCQTRDTGLERARRVRAQAGAVPLARDRSTPCARERSAAVTFAPNASVSLNSSSGDTPQKDDGRAQGSARVVPRHGDDVPTQRVEIEVTEQSRRFDLAGDEGSAVRRLDRPHGVRRCRDVHRIRESAGDPIDAPGVVSTSGRSENCARSVLMLERTASVRSPIRFPLFGTTKRLSVLISPYKHVFR